ncbi:MAG TPA: AbrB/MazE/SpoVT family DNA-binding domain-containing protein [Nitrososphaera sp.]|nr:AbrB/MazE/SpoVT family DNA-binding domain-containing protein [Nitrososphaera sp.]
MAASTTETAARKVKLQKVGNSLRATIPKDMAEMLSLKEGDTVNIMITLGDDDRAKIVIEKIQDDVSTMAKFYGVLKVKEVKKWPGPEEIKSIWE